MDLELNGKVALITGGSKGIGKAIAMELGKEGVDVAIAARSQGPLDEAAEELRSATGRRVVAVAADMMKGDDVQNMVDTTVSQLGRVDILINNAAMVGGQVRGTLAEATEKDMIEDLDTKVVGYFRCMKAVVPHMQRQGWGRIISIGGVSARQSTIYGLRNAAVVHMTKTFSDQLGGDGITLNVVHPGLTLSESVTTMLDKRAESQGVSRADIEKENSQRVAIRRPIDPQELAWVVAFLASPKGALHHRRSDCRRRRRHGGGVPIADPRCHRRARREGRNAAGACRQRPAARRRYRQPAGQPRLHGALPDAGGLCQARRGQCQVPRRALRRLRDGQHPGPGRRGS